MAQPPAQIMVDWARQVILQTKRWLPDRRLIVVADASFAAIDLVAALRRHVCLVRQLRIDASLALSSTGGCPPAKSNTNRRLS